MGIRFDSSFAMLAGIVLWIVIRSLSLLKNKKYKVILTYRELFLNIFAIYCVLVISITIFPIDIVWGEATTTFRPTVNVIPFIDVFQNFSRSNFSLAFKIRLLTRNLAGNLILLMPMGLFLPMLWNKARSFWRTITIGALVSLSIELLQYALTYLGYGMGRATDIDDLILNTLGVMIGYIVFNKMLVRSNTLSQLGN